MEFNSSQQKVIDAPENNIVVVSPAGSGKTHTLIGSIEKYRREHPVDNVVAITFTKKAAAELQERIHALNIEISTIHSWSYRRLQALAMQHGFKVQLLDDQSIKDILKKLCRIRRQFYINDFQLFSYIMGNYNIDIDDSIKKTFEIIRCDYIKFKQSNQLYDFTDLPTYLFDKLAEYNEIIDDIDALYVDEFQDVDPVQLSLFSLTKTKKKLYIGDPDQSIYIFRGAVGDIFEQLLDFKVYNLNINYRSYQEIIDYATTLKHEAKISINESSVYDFITQDYMGVNSIACDRGFGANIYLVDRLGNGRNINKNMSYRHWNNEDNSSYISENSILLSLLKDRKTQVLCRSNKQVKKIKALGIENVSTIHQAKGLEYDNVIIVSFPIDCDEELNIAYVGLTRAKNNLCIIDYEVLLYIICTEDITTSTKLF